MEEWCWALTRLLPVPAGAAPSGVGPPAPGGPPRSKAPPAGAPRRRLPRSRWPGYLQQRDAQSWGLRDGPPRLVWWPFPLWSRCSALPLLWLVQDLLGPPRPSPKVSPGSSVRLCLGETASWQRVQQRVVSQIWSVLLRPCCSTSHINKVICVRKQA